MPRILDLPDDDDGPLGLYAPLRDSPAPDGDNVASPSALDVIRSVVARPQPGYGPNPGRMMQPDAPAARMLNQVFAASGEQEVPYAQEANDAWRPPEDWVFPTAVDGQNDAGAAATENANALYAQLRQPDQRTPALRQRGPRGQPQQPQRRQAPLQRQAPAEPYPPPGISIPPPPQSPPEQPGWGQLPQSGQRPIGAGITDPQLRRSFADRISWAEGNANYDTVGPPIRGGEALGRYQLLPGALVEAGVLARDGRSWTGPIAQRFGIRRRNDFLNNPAAQETALRQLMLYSQGQIRALRLDRYVGRVVDGVRGHFMITYPGLVAAMHRAG